MYLRDEKIIDEHIIDLAGQEAIDVQSNAKCFWVELSKFDLKPIKIKEGDQFHLCGTLTETKNLQYGSSCQLEDAKPDQEKAFKVDREKSKYSTSYTDPNCGHFPFILYALYWTS